MLLLRLDSQTLGLGPGADDRCFGNSEGTGCGGSFSGGGRVGSGGSGCGGLGYELGVLELGALLLCNSPCFFCIVSHLRGRDGSTGGGSCFNFGFSGCGSCGDRACFGGHLEGRGGSGLLDGDRSFIGGFYGCSLCCSLRLLVFQKRFFSVMLVLLSGRGSSGSVGFIRSICRSRCFSGGLCLVLYNQFFFETRKFDL